MTEETTSDPADIAYDEVLAECSQILDKDEMRAARIAARKMRDRWKSATQQD